MFSIAIGIRVERTLNAPIISVAFPCDPLPLFADEPLELECVHMVKKTSAGEGCLTISGSV